MSYVRKHNLCPRLEERLAIAHSSLFPVDSNEDRFVIIAGLNKMSLNRKSSAGAGFSHLVTLFIGRRDRRRFTDRIRSSPTGVYTSDPGEPSCTTNESWESSTVIRECGMRGGGDDLSSTEAHRYTAAPIV